MGYYNNSQQERFALVESLKEESLLLTKDTIFPGAKYVIETFIREANAYKDGEFSIVVFSDGVVKDWSLNGWTYSYCCNGTYHLSSINYPAFFSFVIKGIMPNGKMFEKTIRKYENPNGRNIALCLLKETEELSCCNTLEEYDVLDSLNVSKVTYLPHIIQLCQKIDYARMQIQTMKPEMEKEGAVPSPYYVKLKEKTIEAFSILKESITSLDQTVLL